MKVAQSLIVMLTSVGDWTAARRIAQALLDRRLAACVQMNEIESHYRWQGNVEQSREVRLLIKTVSGQRERVERLIMELHDYELPGVVTLNVIDANLPYQRWVNENADGA